MLLRLFSDTVSKILCRNSMSQRPRRIVCALTIREVVRISAISSGGIRPNSKHLARIFFNSSLALCAIFLNLTSLLFGKCADDWSKITDLLHCSVLAWFQYELEWHLLLLVARLVRKRNALPALWCVMCVLAVTSNRHHKVTVGLEWRWDHFLAKKAKLLILRPLLCTVNELFRG